MDDQDLLYPLVIVKSQGGRVFLCTESLDELGSEVGSEVRESLNSEGTYRLSIKELHRSAAEVEPMPYRI
ncbi:hypothetical protein L195_g004454 [Trifolium pratense]|uniref:Uncharacterized protein n=1 Tax=Trifolium pratense TaxID=57577 RepID=A0A2K3NY27_TRIPR|nr:hypothetical protein L195_g004454 [Trifolium pratense]